MFFNGKKLTTNKPKESRKVEFTDKLCRNYVPAEFKKGIRISDSLCKNLNMLISEFGNHTYHISCGPCDRTIGSVHTTSLKEAREIVINIRENLDEFLKEAPTIKVPLVLYFKTYGKFPHPPKGTETILSDENSSLKQKIKDLQKEVENLSDENIRLRSRLSTISRVANYDETDLEMAD